MQINIFTPAGVPVQQGVPRVSVSDVPSVTTRAGESVQQRATGLLSAEHISVYIPVGMSAQ